MPRTARRDEGQWAVSGRTPLTAGEQAKQDDDGINVRARIEQRYALRGIRRDRPRRPARRFRWWGLYTQRRPGIDGGRTGALEDADIEDSYFMLRVRVRGGQLDAEQLRVIGEVADEFGRGVADVTDRQNIQYHWIRIEDVPEIWRRLESVGLTTPTTCGDAPRNILGCPVAGIDADEIVDASGVLEATEAVARASDDLTNLPRKWKTAISGCASYCTVHEINDVSFVGVRTPDGATGFDLWVGGGLSTNPMIAQRLGAFVEPRRVPAVWRGVTELFRDYGYRRLRNRARLKFLVADWGPERFREVLEKEYLGVALPDGPAPPPPAAGSRDHVGVHRQRRPVLRRRRAAGRPDVGHASSSTSPASRDLRVGPGADDRRAEAADPRRARRPGGPAGRRAHRAGPDPGAVRVPARHHRLHRHRVLQARHRRDQGAAPSTCTASSSGGSPTSTPRSRSTSTGARTPAHGSSSPTSASRARSSTAPRASRCTSAATSPRGRADPGFGRKLRGLKVTAEQLPDYVERLLRTYRTHRTDGEAFAAWVQRAEEGLLQ